MHRCHIGVDFEVSDNQREHAKIIAGLEIATAEYEAAIKQVTGKEVQLSVAVRRHKDGKPVPAEAKASDAQIVQTAAAGEAVEEKPVASTAQHRSAARIAAE